MCRIQIRGRFKGRLLLSSLFLSSLLYCHWLTAFTSSVGFIWLLCQLKKINPAATNQYAIAEVSVKITTKHQSCHSGFQSFVTFAENQKMCLIHEGLCQSWYFWISVKKKNSMDLMHFHNFNLKFTLYLKRIIILISLNNTKYITLLVSHTYIHFYH